MARSMLRLSGLSLPLDHPPEAIAPAICARLGIAAEELPTRAEIHRMMASLGMPLTPQDIGFTDRDTTDALLGARDIRNKYLTSSMLWDLGLLYEEAPDWIR